MVSDPAIQERNQRILDGFAACLSEQGLSRKAVKSHVAGIAFFAVYLLNDSKRLDQADETDITMFLGFWFPQEATWASVDSTKQYMGSFSKFIHWMGETGRCLPEVVEDVMIVLKEDRGRFLDALQQRETRA